MQTLPDYDSPAASSYFAPTPERVEQAQAVIENARKLREHIVASALDIIDQHNHKNHEFPYSLKDVSAYRQEVYDIFFHDAVRDAEQRILDEGYLV